MALLLTVPYQIVYLYMYNHLLYYVSSHELSISKLDKKEHCNEGRRHKENFLPSGFDYRR